MRRVPDRRVDSVQDAHDPFPARPQIAIEAHAAFRGTDLVRVRGRDGGDHVRGDDCALEEVHVAAVLDRAARPHVVGEAEAREFLAAVDALIAEVVDREHGRDVVEPGVAPVAPGAEHRRERGMPVVRVKDAGPPVEPFQRVNRRAHEESEAPEAVVLALFVRRVDLIPVEQRVVRDEVDRHDAPGQEIPEQAHRMRATEDRDLEGRHRGLGPQVAPPVPACRLEVEGHEHVHVVASGGERLGEGADDVSESSRLGERDALRGEMRDAQARLSSRERPRRASSWTSRRKFAPRRARRR